MRISHRIIVILYIFLVYTDVEHMKTKEVLLNGLYCDTSYIVIFTLFIKSLISNEAPTREEKICRLFYRTYHYLDHFETDLKLFQTDLEVSKVK